MRLRTSLVAGAVLLWAPLLAWAGGPIAVVAAENFYGDLAQQIGGSSVKVTSILSNPDQDPHLFEASPSVAREVSAAQIVIYNGVDYDPWIEKLLGATHSSDRKAIVVADLVGRKHGENPHVWYDLSAVLALATALADDLGAADPEHRSAYQQNLSRFEQSMQPIQAKITALRGRLAGIPVTATEPVFGYMLDAIGVEVRNQPFQLAVMNNTEPSASDVVAFEKDLKEHRVRMLIYNRQASDPVAERMVKLAKTSHIPVVAVTETEPPGTNYQSWLLTELAAVDKAVPSK